MKFSRVTALLDSNTLRGVSYLPNQRRLRVFFRRNDAIWDYFDVPSTEYASLVAAVSPGAVFNERIRDRYRGVEITVEEHEGREIAATKKQRGKIVMLDNYEE